MTVISSSPSISPGRTTRELEQRYLVEGVLYAALEAVRFVAVLAHPILPQATQKIWTQLGCQEYLGTIEEQRFGSIQVGRTEPGAKIGKPEGIFPRLDKAADPG